MCWILHALIWIVPVRYWWMNVLSSLFPLLTFEKVVAFYIINLKIEDSVPVFTSHPTGSSLTLYTENKVRSPFFASSITLIGSFLCQLKDFVQSLVVIFPIRGTTGPISGLTKSINYIFRLLRTYFWRLAENRPCSKATN